MEKELSYIKLLRYRVRMPEDLHGDSGFYGPDRMVMEAYWRDLQSRLQRHIKATHVE